VGWRQRGRFVAVRHLMPRNGTVSPGKHSLLLRFHQIAPATRIPASFML
jgi:hypothetical protein